jgi:O-antigen ligase
MIFAVPVAIAAGVVILRQPFLGLAALVAFVQLDAIAALIFSGLPVSGIKILALLTLAGLIYNYRNRSGARQHDPAPLAATFLILLLLTLLISVVLAHDLGLALSELRRFAGVVLLCYLVIVLADTTERLEVLLLAIMATTLISSLVIIHDWYFGDNLFAAQRTIRYTDLVDGYRSSGASAGAATSAATLLLCGTTLVFVFCVRTPRWRLFTAATAVIGSLGIFFNSTRSASITYLIMLVWLLFKLRKSPAFPVLLGCAVLVLVALLPLVPADYWVRFSALFEPGKDFTIDRRISYHLIGLDLLQQYPLFGAGFGNFPLYFVDFDYRWIPGTKPDEDGLKQLHNQYLQIAAESGIIALACYLGLLAACLACLNRVRKEAASPKIRVIAEAVQYSFVSLLIQIAFLSSKLNKYLWIYIGIAIALHYLNKARARDGAHDERAAA